jgi:hypothetical protein
MAVSTPLSNPLPPLLALALPPSPNKLGCPSFIPIQIHPPGDGATAGQGGKLHLAGVGRVGRLVQVLIQALYLADGGLHRGWVVFAAGHELVDRAKMLVHSRRWIAGGASNRGAGAERIAHDASQLVLLQRQALSPLEQCESCDLLAHLGRAALDFSERLVGRIGPAELGLAVNGGQQVAQRRIRGRRQVQLVQPANGNGQAFRVSC